METSEQTRAHEYIMEEVARKLRSDPDKYHEKKISLGYSYVVVTVLSRNPNVILKLQQGLER